MELSGKTIDALCGMITGDIDEDYPYRTGPNLINFFSRYGYDESYGSHFPSRTRYTEEKLKELNGTDQMRQVIREALDPRHFQSAEVDVEDAAKRLDFFLDFDGYDLEKDGPYYTVVEVSTETVDMEASLSDFEIGDRRIIREQLRKCRQKIGTEDYNGAITNARTVIEAVLIGVEEDLSGKPLDYNGDLPALYKRVYSRLNLDPGAEDLETNLRQILSGLISVVNGLSGIRNRMSDSHATSYRADRRHAKLAVNTAKTFVEFILESYQYQRGREGER
jgi:hypothetical protein